MVRSQDSVGWRIPSARPSSLRSSQFSNEEDRSSRKTLMAVRTSATRSTLMSRARIAGNSSEYRTRSPAAWEDSTMIRPRWTP
jgi:hypothetical protein